MSNNLILFVFEGEKKERQVVESFKEYFSDFDKIVVSAYCTTIYSLYNKLEKDNDLNLFGLLKEKPKNSNLLKYKSKQFAEIYLFFDYDGHTNVSDDSKLLKAIKYFKEETAFGKLYISYPMVESLKHYDFAENDFKDLKVECKKDISYKKLVNRECNPNLIDFNKFTKDIWNLLIKVHLKKMNYIICDDFTLPKLKYSQIEILENQIKKFINVDSTVSVLSSFPIFLYDYFDSANLEEFFSLPE